MKHLWSLAAIALALTGCAANQQYFQPTERVEGRTQQGRKLAIYPLTVAEGPVGEAKVWSGGAYKTKDEGTVVRIGLEVHNTSSTPIELKPGDLELKVTVDDYGRLDGLQPMDPTARAFPPGGTAQVNPTFALPPGVSPGDIEDMRLDWRVHADGQVYAQSTPFTEEVNPVYYDSYPYGGPCGPYGCGAFGGWGWGWGPGFHSGIYAPIYYHRGPSVHYLHRHHVHHGHVHHGHHGGHHGHHGGHHGHHGGHHGHHGGHHGHRH